MAAPAAILSILVTANAKQAQAALAKTQGQLVATSRTANATSASMKRLGTAAKWSGAIMAGGLYFGLKKSVEEAREANKVMAQTEAVLKSTGKAAGLSAKEVENLAEKLSEKAGIDDEVIQSGENLLLTFKNIRNEAGKGNKIFDQTTALAVDMSAALGQDMKSSAIQLGKALNDPSVGLTALRRVGVSFTEQQTEQILKMQESGDLMGAQKKILAELTTEFKGSAKSQADAGDRLTVIFNNMAEDIGQKVVPVLSDMAETVSDILSNKKMSGDQKADALAKYFTEMFSKGLDALENALPQIAEMGARMGLRLAQSFGKAFIEADLLGKLFLGGMLFKAIGGMAAIRASGESAGKVFGRAFAYGAVALFGIELLTWLMKNREKIIAAAQGKETLPNVLMDEGMPAKRALAVSELMQKRGVSQGSAMEILREQHDFQKKWTDTAEEGVKDRQRIYEGANRRLNDELNDSHRKAQRGFESNRDKLDDVTRNQARRVIGNVDNMVSGTSQGLKRLADNTNKSLKAYGAKPLEFAIDLNKSSSGGGFHGFQRGGPINTGAPSGDTVPAMLEKGEYVLNRNAVGAVGKGNLDALNFGAAKRFQSGGVVEALGPYSISPFQYDANHAGGNSHMHIAMSTSAAVVALGRKLQQMGMMVGEHPAFGGVDPVHTAGSYHYSGRAIDVNTAANETRSEVSAVARLLGGGGFGAVAQKLKKILLTGPDGPLKSMGQGSLDKSWKAAQAFIDSQAPKTTGGAAMSGSGEVESMFAKVAKRLSTSKAATLALGMAGYAESGMQDLSYGHSSSQGALQLLASTAAGLGISPHDEQAIASHFLLRGFYGRGGANTLAASGLPAHLVAQNVQGSAFSSGSNYLAQAGPAKAWMQRYGLQKGGQVLPYVGKYHQGGIAPREGLAHVAKGEHIGITPKVEVHLHGPGMDAMVGEMYAVVDGAKVEIADYVMRQGGRGAGRSRQLARG